MKKSTKWRQWGIVAGVAAVILVLPLAVRSSYLHHVLIIAFIYTAGSVSARTILLSGQFPMAHGAFMAIGGYTSGLMALRWGVSPWAGMILGAVVAGVIATLFAYPFSRLRAFYYCMGSLLVGIAIINLIYAFSGVTGGWSGLAGVPRLIETGSKVPYYYMALALALLVIVICYRWEHSRVGLHVRAVTESHLMASSLGINEARYRVLVVGFGSTLAGLVGAFYVHYLAVAAPTQFDMSITFWLLMFVLVGGQYRFAGPLVGVGLLYIIPELFRDFGKYSPLLTAGILIAFVYVMPKGEGAIDLLAKARLWRARRGLVEQTRASEHRGR
jgi:branched-chain amino acid transport system permease protein